MKLINSVSQDILINGLLIKEVEGEENGNGFGICSQCIDKFNSPIGLGFSEEGSGCCMVKGCENVADHYVAISSSNVDFRYTVANRTSALYTEDLFVPNIYPSIYKISVVVIMEIPRRSTDLTIHFEEQYVYGNFENAYSLYKSMRDKGRCFRGYGNSSVKGYCMLYVPLIMGDGTVANIPKPLRGVDKVYLALDLWGCENYEDIFRIRSRI